MSSLKKHRFQTISRVDVPQGREGKHKKIVTDILGDLSVLKEGAAIKIPLNQIDSKEKVRSALNRASRKLKLVVATAADSEYLYIWNAKHKPD